jgi:RNA polymerase sigma factor (sigma-70 family)
VNPVAAVRRTSAPDGVLVQEAAAGGGGSYAALYDRYSEQVYNYCLRLTGSPEDAADATQDAFVKVLARLQHDESPVLDFAAYLFTAARNESYALMRRRSRTELSDVTPEPAVAVAVPDVTTDPERAALLQDSQEAVRKANAELAPRHREVLALREVAGRSYDEIGHIMGISENAAAQLIWRARSKLKGALTAGAVASVVATSEECEAAQILINRLHDGESITDEEQLWLDEHLDECGKCRAARGMIFEVAASYRAWAPVAVLAALRPDVLTSAGAAIGADWTGVAATHAAHAGGAQAAAGVAGRGAVRTARRSHMAAGGAVGATVLAVAGIAISALLGDDEQARKTVPPPAGTPKAEAAPKKAARAKPLRKPAVLTPASLPRSVPPPQEHAAPPRESKKIPPATPKPRAERPSAPPNPPVNRPVRPAPAPNVAPPPPATRGECSWPGHGNGPGGCPPGHGGVPPGQGGVPPGRAKKAPKSRVKAPKIRAKVPPGHGGTPRGHAKHR